MSEHLSYVQTGVDIDTTDAVKRDMAASVDSGDARVLNRMGAFASLVEGRFEGYTHPILVLKTEEPGSKQKLAFQHGRISSIAHDLINHLINDLIVMGAAPLYVQDCIICGVIESEVVKTLVAGMADACRLQGCVLVGGETSVQPGVVADGVYVLSASAVGVVEKDRILDGAGIAESDVVLAVASNGLHTNGYTLVRALMDKNPELPQRKIDGESFLDVIMRPHTCYYTAVRDLFPHSGLKGLAHITGGGIEGNLNRILPSHVDASIDKGLIRIPKIFKVIREQGNVPEDDMLKTFNMGVGLTLVCTPESVDEIVALLAQHECASYPIGRIEKGTGVVKYSGTLTW
jgi:phosphoribosylformylglycinamidine cyclo-ligase